MPTARSSGAGQQGRASPQCSRRRSGGGNAVRLQVEQTWPGPSMQPPPGEPQRSPFSWAEFMASLACPCMRAFLLPDATVEGSPSAPLYVETSQRKVFGLDPAAAPLPENVIRRAALRS